MKFCRKVHLYFYNNAPCNSTQVRWVGFLVGNFQRFMKVCGHGHSRNIHKSCLFFQILEQIMWYVKEVWINSRWVSITKVHYWIIHNYNKEVVVRSTSSQMSSLKLRHIFEWIFTNYLVSSSDISQNMLDIHSKICHNSKVDVWLVSSS